MQLTIVLYSHSTATEESRSYALLLKGIQVQRQRGYAEMVRPLHREEKADGQDTGEKTHDFKFNILCVALSCRAILTATD